MENIQQKARFLKTEYTEVLHDLDANAPRKWGKMNVQQMIEHMSDYVRIASGRTPMDVITPAENLERMQSFLASEKPFRENTPNALMADDPAPTRHETKDEALSELQGEINYFFDAFAKDPSKTLNNPFFGVLNYQQQVQLLYKHATHHLRQFGMDY
ncbi:MAG: DinB family protein [Taibaiella sp.]|nr:DinB family protein [Taibaiella sp.]